MTPKKNWMLTACALCGQRFPLTAPMYANMSGTTHQAQLPCPCETRRPPDPPAVPQKELKDMTDDELVALLADARMIYPNAIVDLDP